MNRTKAVEFEKGTKSGVSLGTKLPPKGSSLRDELASKTKARLLEIAQDYGLNVAKGTSKADLVDLLAKRVGQGR